jgi:glutamine amidotransferase
VAPFASGRWLFSHNGRLDGWPESAAALAATLPATALLGLEARVDSALLWALVLHRLRVGLAPAEALADTVRALQAAGVTGRFNFLLTDGQVIAATAAGDTLWHRSSGASASGPSGPAASPSGPAASPSGPPVPAVVVASEPGDDEPGWTEVPDGCVVTAAPGRVSVARLAGLNARATDDKNIDDGRIAIP